MSPFVQRRCAAVNEQSPRAATGTGGRRGRPACLLRQVTDLPMEKQTWTPRRIFEHDGAQTEPAGSGSRPHWAAGSFALLVRWVGRWALTHELVKGSTVCDTAVDLDSPIPVRCTNALAEPGVMPWLD